MGDNAAGDGAAEGSEADVSRLLVGLGFAANALKMLELSFLSAGGFVTPFLLPCSDLLVSDLVLAVRPRAGLTSGGVDVFAAVCTSAGVRVVAAAAIAAGGGLAPSLRYTFLSTEMIQGGHRSSSYFSQRIVYCAVLLPGLQRILICISACNLSVAV